MEIIPVIDLKGGQVVHARQGLRDSYRPLSTPLCASSEPAAVLDALLRLRPFGVIYFADLDAITGQPPQQALIESLQREQPKTEFWVDAGWPAATGVSWVPVIGSESLDGAAWVQLKGFGSQWILSLDRLDGVFQGPAEILQQSESWPGRIIHMNLNRVGGSDGPDIEGLRELVTLVPAQRLVAAGGVRDWGDVRALEAIGIPRVLVASSLHTGSLFPLR